MQSDLNPRPTVHSGSQLAVGIGQVDFCFQVRDSDRNQATAAPRRRKTPPRLGIDLEQHFLTDSNFGRFLLAHSDKDPQRIDPSDGDNGAILWTDERACIEAALHDHAINGRFDFCFTESNCDGLKLGSGGGFGGFGLRQRGAALLKLLRRHHTRRGQRAKPRAILFGLFQRRFGLLKLSARRLELIGQLTRTHQRKKLAFFTTSPRSTSTALR